jgi:hypothetical protein
MDEHTPGLKRRFTDAELQKHTTTELKDLAGECDVEPADASICDACTAYLILVERSNNEVVLRPADADEFRLANEFVLGATDADALHPPHQVRDGLLAYQVAANRDEWMARAMVAEAAVAELVEERDALKTERQSLMDHIGQEMARAMAMRMERPFLFMPGDRVIVLMASVLEPATVQQIRIPGPINADQTVQVVLDTPHPGQPTAMWWFNPDQVERLGG